MLFRPKPPVDQQEYDWLVACFAWLRTVLDDADIRPDLILPDDPRLQQASTASALFNAVKDICGMADWPCRLELVDVDTDPGDMRVERRFANASGTFSVEGEEAVIRYSSQMLRDPDGLAATFAHELSHYLTHSFGDPPGGPDLMEHATDCTAIYLGFGVLLSNHARSFSQWNDGEWQGWQSMTHGYLSEQARVTATAMFAALHDHPTDSAQAALKPYLRKDFAKAGKAIARDYPDFAATLSDVDLAEWNYA